MSRSARPSASARGFCRKALDAGAVADVADAAQGHHRGAGRDPAGGRGRNGAGAHRLCRRHADAGRSDPDAGAEWRRLVGCRIEFGVARAPRSASTTVSSMQGSAAARASARRAPAPRPPRGRRWPRRSPEAQAAPRRSGFDLSRTGRAGRREARSPDQGSAGKRRAAGAHRGWTAGSRARAQCAALAGQRPVAQAGAMDRPALDRDRVQRGRAADAACAGRSRKRTSASAVQKPIRACRT